MFESKSDMLNDPIKSDVDGMFLTLSISLFPLSLSFSTSLPLLTVRVKLMDLLQLKCVCVCVGSRQFERPNGQTSVSVIFFYTIYDVYKHFVKNESTR